MLLSTPATMSASTMLGLSALALCQAALPPIPPAMTPWQTEYMVGVRKSAQAASEAAQPALLNAFGDAEFRAGLDKCCPGIAKLSAPELLAWFHAQTDVSEMVHNFDAANDPTNGGGHHGGDPDLAVYSAGRWFYNLWEPCLLNLTSSCDEGPEDAGETGLFGMPEFSNGKMPSTLLEATQRPVYTAFNHRMIDAGNPHFGDVSMVYSPDFVRPMTIIAPMDTGMWTMSCNSSFHFPSGPPCDSAKNESACAESNFGSCVWAGGACKANPHPAHHHHHGGFGHATNCSVSDWTNVTNTFALGTLEHYDHLVLAGTYVATASGCLLPAACYACVEGIVWVSSVRGPF